MRLVCLDKEQVAPVWPHIKRLAVQACRFTDGDVTPYSLRKAAEAGDVKLWVVIRPDEEDPGKRFVALLASELHVALSDQTAVHVFCFGGRHRDEWAPLLEGVHDWARKQGARRLLLTSGKSSARDFRDFTVVGHVMDRTPEVGPVPEAGTIRVYVLAPSQVYGLWPKLEGHVERVVEHSQGELTADAVRDHARTGSIQLWVAVDTSRNDAGMWRAVVGTQVQPTLAGGNICRIVLASGHKRAEWVPAMSRALQDWCLSQGFKRLDLLGRRGWLRALPDFRFKAFIMERNTENVPVREFEKDNVWVQPTGQVFDGTYRPASE